MIATLEGARNVQCVKFCIFFNMIFDKYKKYKSNILIYFASQKIAESYFNLNAQKCKLYHTYAFCINSEVNQYIKIGVWRVLMMSYPMALFVFVNSGKTPGRLVVRTYILSITASCKKWSYSFYNNTYNFCKIKVSAIGKTNYN